MRFDQVDILIRWLHVFAGIVWIGHLYFFNFVNVPLQGALDDAAKKSVNPHLMPRALWWFRWGAMITFLAGLALFALVYMYTPGLGFGPSALFSGPDGITPRAWLILFGMLLATVMWFNVWFVIWPTQKKLLSGQVPADQAPAARAKALLFSRVNTYLSGPMLFGMLGASHYAAAGALSYAVFIAAGLAAIYGSIQASYNVGKTV